MAEAILLDLAGLIERHPWWRARSALTLSLLRHLRIGPPARVLDAGCGWGTTFLALERAGYRVTGMDVSRRALERLARPGRDLVVADLTRPIPNGLDVHDAVLALDVIEHIDDDREAVQGLARLVRPGGVVVVSVPARPDLFTEFDAIQGHRRRYLPGMLRAAFDGTALEVERVFWWGQWLLPMIRRQRAGAKRAHPNDSPAEIYRRYLRLPPWPASRLLDIGFRLERERAIAGKLATGTSLFAVARRPH